MGVLVTVIWLMGTVISHAAGYALPLSFGGQAHFGYVLSLPKGGTGFEQVCHEFHVFIRQV